MSTVQKTINQNRVFLDDTARVMSTVHVVGANTCLDGIQEDSTSDFINEIAAIPAVEE